jgi:hypothetical protein
VFEGGQLAGQIGVRRVKFAEAHERPARPRATGGKWARGKRS